jgi:hypothetical protein
MIWMLAGAGVLAAGVALIPATGTGQFVLGFFFVTVFVFAYRPWLVDLREPVSLAPDARILSLRRRRDALLGIAPRTFQKERSNHILRALVVVVLAAPLALGVWGWAAGANPVVPSWRLGLHLGLMFVWGVLWVPVRNRNLRGARELDREIEVLETG